MELFTGPHKGQPLTTTGPSFRPPPQLRAPPYLSLPRLRHLRSPLRPAPVAGQVRAHPDPRRRRLLPQLLMFTSIPQTTWAWRASIISSCRPSSSCRSSHNLMGIGFPRSFAVSFVRSASILFQGLWFILMGFVLWTPALVFKGCFMHMRKAHGGPLPWRCALHRAKSLVNLQFSWFLAGVSIFSVLFYLYVTRSTGSSGIHLESQRRTEETQSFVHMSKGFAEMDLER
ncbi:unnamed protein product [Spirodela intermedia]|uniref:Uncharacterized protein n=1 Tax=Spirodela intermedia TaxID=51605 RepID=A0A7I8J5L5_SPIIN|nr:unnamed protein product [Spirodela intermedia]CAA6664693.1 unnamed protein product [Spirodela intermedia]